MEHGEDKIKRFVEREACVGSEKVTAGAKGRIRKTRFPEYSKGRRKVLG